MRTKQKGVPQEPNILNPRIMAYTYHQVNIQRVSTVKYRGTVIERYGANVRRDKGTGKQC